VVGSRCDATHLFARCGQSLILSDMTAVLFAVLASIGLAADSSVFGWIDEYDALRTALALDQFDRSTAAAVELAADLSIDAEMRAAVQAVADAPDLASRRNAFGSLSRTVVLHLASAPDAPKVVVYRCAMFQGFPFLVQLKNGLVNPYMGQEMPGCGEQVSLKAAVKVANASTNP
jgi:hypothetical protein